MKMGMVAVMVVFMLMQPLSGMVMGVGMAFTFDEVSDADNHIDKAESDKKPGR